MNFRRKKTEKLFYDKLTGFVWNNGLIVCFALLLTLQRGFGGFGYRACIDDWFLYLSTSLQNDMWYEYILPNNKLAIRPFSGIVDCYIITPLANNLGLISLVTAIMLFAAMVMLFVFFRKNKIDTGGVFLLLAAMYPVFMEALYWLSCASRIVPAIFFTALSGILLTQFFEKKRFSYFLVYVFTGMLSVGFYETVIPIYLIICLIPIFRNFRDPASKFLIVIPIIHIVIIAAYYYINSSGSTEIMTRGAITSMGTLPGHISEVFNELKNFFLNINTQIFSDGFIKGFNLIKNTNPVYMIPVAAISVLFGIFSGSFHGRSEKAFTSLIIGLILFAAGLVTNFALENIRIPVRVVYISFIGLGIFVNSLLSLILWGMPGKVIYGILSAIMAFVFTVGGIGEIDNYREVGRLDVDIAASMLTNPDTASSVTDENTHIWLFGAPVYHNEVDTIQYYEHIKASTESSAAFTGSLIYYTDNENINPVVTVADGAETNLYTPSSEEIFCYYGLEEDYSISVLAMHEIPSNEENNAAADYELIRNDGTVFGILEHMTKNIYRFDKN